MDRVFTDEELRLGSMRSVDALAEAVAQGDPVAAEGFARRLRREVLSMQQNYDGWETSLRDSIRRLDGEAAEVRALSEIENPEIAPECCEPADPDRIDRWRAAGREILEALEQGRSQDALSLARNLHEEALQSHDRGMARVSALLSWITVNQGADAVEAALEVAMSADMLGDASFRERAEMLMHFTRVHLQSFSLTEDDEKITFLCPVCPSGGRLLQAGHYEAPRPGAHVEGPRAITWGRASLPVYCCHEPVMEKASIQKTGVPLFVVEPSERLGVDPCPTYLYKDPAAIPARYYERVGLEKPTDSSGS